MNPIRYWRRKTKSEQKNTFLFVAIATATLFLGGVFGVIVSQEFGPESISRQEFIAKEKQLALRDQYQRLERKPANLFWLGARPGYEAFVRDNTVFYLPESKPFRINNLNSSEQIISEPIARANVAAILRSLKPLQPVGKQQYWNKERKIFVWLRSKNNKIYLIRSENISENPGDLK